MSKNLHTDMTEDEFERGYWYATELRAFAVRLGVRRASRLRKDQLEAEIRHYLRSGHVRDAPNPRAPGGPRDVEVPGGLRWDLPVKRYVNDEETKAFILRECQRIDPQFRPKSGTRYPLNRWREEMLAHGQRITYGDLVRRFLEINAAKDGPLRTEQGRYNNFVADYRAATPGATHAQVVRGWQELKELDIPKTYAAWAAYRDRT